MTSTFRTNYSPAEVRTVKQVMDRHIGPENAADIIEIVVECGLADRLVRQVTACLAGKMRVPPRCVNSRGRGRTLGLGASSVSKSIPSDSADLARARSRRYYLKHLAPSAEPLSGLPVTETWRPIPGYGAGYAVSDQGRVLGYQRFRPRLLKPHEHPKTGYFAVLLHRPSDKPRSITVHSLVALAFIGERQPDQQVNHKDGVKAHNAVENLEYVTAAENLRHAAETGLRQPGRFEVRRGEQHPNSKLTDAQVAEIRALGGGNASAIARRYGVTRTAIRNIWLGINWKAGS